jgi:hypothetical protein
VTRASNAVRCRGTGCKLYKFRPLRVRTNGARVDEDCQARTCPSPGGEPSASAPRTPWSLGARPAAPGQLYALGGRAAGPATASSGRARRPRRTGVAVEVPSGRSATHSAISASTKRTWPMSSANPCPMRRPTIGMAVSKAPTTIAMRRRSLASTPVTPMPIDAAKFDRPRAPATKRSHSTVETLGLSSGQSGVRRWDRLPGLAVRAGCHELLDAYC